MTAGAANLSPKDNAFFSGLFELFDVDLGIEAANAITVTVTVQNQVARSIGERGSFFCYLSTDAEGDNLTSSAPDGGVANGANGFLIPLVTGKAFQAITNASGVVSFVITESTVKTFYLICKSPSGRLYSTAIAFA